MNISVYMNKRYYNSLYLFFLNKKGRLKKEYYGLVANYPTGDRLDLNLLAGCDDVEFLRKYFNEFL